MADKPSSLILRFRDLSTPLGDTIKEHQALIAAKKFVWWGWWSKGGERIPLETIASLNNIARNKTLRLLLFDSGQEKLYLAKCNEILWDRDTNRISSPDPGRTPGYYGKNKYLCWFKFTEIVEAGNPEKELKKLTYVQVDEFFTEPPSKFLAFYGKQISSLKELQAQPRSIWFTRPYTKTDRSHEILLLDYQKLSPSEFPETFREKKSTKILWISDLHCSVGKFHSFPVKRSAGRDDFATALKKALTSNGIGELAGVIVSGDITWRAEADEFSMAFYALRDLKSHQANLEWYDFCVCPGNHDIAFSKDPSDPSLPVANPLEKARLNYDDLYKSLFYIKPSLHMSSGRKFLLGNLLPVEIAVFNSSSLQQEKKHFQGHGFIGDEQLDAVAKSMGWNKNSPKSLGYRIAVLHHHILPVSFRDTPQRDTSYSVLLDAEAFSRWIVQHRVNLVLHGHMHQPFHSRVSRLPELVPDPDPSDYHEYDVVGLGSSGVKLEHVGEVGHNTFAILDFSDGECVIEIYSLHPTNPSRKLYKILTAKKS